MNKATKTNLLLLLYNNYFKRTDSWPETQVQNQGSQLNCSWICRFVCLSVCLSANCESWEEAMPVAQVKDPLQLPRLSGLVASRQIQNYFGRAPSRTVYLQGLWKPSWGLESLFPRGKQWMVKLLFPRGKPHNLINWRISKTYECFKMLEDFRDSFLLSLGCD